MYSASISSWYAQLVWPVTGDRAGCGGPVSGRTVAPANQRQVITTPALYQSDIRCWARSSWRRSAVTHSAAKVARGTPRLAAGILAISAAVTSTPPSVTPHYRQYEEPGTNRPRRTARGPDDVHITRQDRHRWCRQVERGMAFALRFLKARQPEIVGGPRIAENSSYDWRQEYTYIKDIRSGSQELTHTGQ
jgi:hypothetical protein